MIDMHCHVLPGIDDGPETIEGSVELARMAAGAGVRRIVATPHVNARCHNDAATIARLVAEVNDRLASEGIALDVLPGAEIAITTLHEIAPEELSRLSLGGGPWLLVEPPFTLVAPGIEGAVFELRRAGHEVLLAHPERCPALQREPRVVRSLVASGVLMSITAGALVGRFGRDVRRFALELMRDGLVHNVASDAHDTSRRPPGIAAELREAGFGALREWLTEQVPSAILAGEPVPSAPAAASAHPPRWPLRVRRR